MYQTIHIQMHQRGVLFKHCVPDRVLEPGVHRVFGTGIKLVLFDTTSVLVQDMRAEVRALFSTGAIAEVTIGPLERGVLSVDGRPSYYLDPGTHRYWTVGEPVTLTVFDLTQPVPDLTTAMRQLIAYSGLVDIVVNQHQRGLLYTEGRFERELVPGHYLLWSYQGMERSVTLIDMRGKALVISGQELMTRDKVSLRLTLTAEYAPLESDKAVHAVTDLEQSVYVMVQLVARDYVASVTLDQLLEGRDAMNRYLNEVIAPQATELGVVVRRVGVKDIVLPGEMKALLNKVIEAEKAAKAQAIFRRQEAAGTKAMAQSATVLAEHPVLMRLKELDAFAAIAGQIDDLKLVIGPEQLKSLVGNSGGEREA